jgi:ABC-type polysaccharide/polyol phosphate export permease
VIWKVEALEPSLRPYLDYNPFHVFLELLRAPLLGQHPPAHYWWTALALLFVNAALGFSVFARFRKRITYWL